MDMFSVLLSICWGVKLLGHTVILCLTEELPDFSIVAALFYISLVVVWFFESSESFLNLSHNLNIFKVIFHFKMSYILSHFYVGSVKFIKFGVRQMEFLFFLN